MINHFNSDSSGLRFWERSRGVAVQAFPGNFVNFGFESGFEGFVWIVGSEEISVADKEVFFVIVGVNEPASDAIGSTGLDFARLGTEDIDAVEFDLDVLVLDALNLDIGFTKDDEEVPGSGVLEVVCHVEIRVHPGFEDGDVAKSGEVSGMGIEAESTGNQDIKSRIASFTSCAHKIGTRNGSKLWTDEDACAFFLFAFEVASFSTDVFSGPAGECGEVDFVFFVGLLDAGGFEVFEDDGGKVDRTFPMVCCLTGIDQVIVFIDGKDAVGREAFDGERSSDSDDRFIFKGFVVEEFLIGFGGDRGIDFFCLWIRCFHH